MKDYNFFIIIHMYIIIGPWIAFLIYSYEPMISIFLLLIEFMCAIFDAAYIDELANGFSENKKNKKIYKKMKDRYIYYKTIGRIDDSLNLFEEMKE